MNRKAAVAPFVLLLLTLAACAPGVIGSSARNALTVAPGETIEAQPGQELYVLVPYPLDQFGMRPNELSGSFWIPEGTDEQSSNASNRFALRDVRVPAGWTLAMEQIRVHQERETRRGRTEGTIYTVQPVFRVVVSPQAELGTSSLQARLQPRGGDAVTVNLPVRVRAAQAN